MIKIYSLDLWCIKLDFWTVIPPFYGLFIQWLLPKNIFSHNPSQQCLSPCRCWCVSFHKLLCPADDPCYCFNNDNNNPRKSIEFLLSSHVVRKPTVLVNRNLFQGEKVLSGRGKNFAYFQTFQRDIYKAIAPLLLRPRSEPVLLYTDVMLEACCWALQTDMSLAKKFIV